MAAAIPELLGLSISEGVAFALGIAMGPALEPLTREITNTSWAAVVNESKGSISRPLDASALADIVAESVEALGWGRDEAKKEGISEADFDALFNAAQDAPGFGTLLQLLRRDLIQTDDFVHGLRKAKFEGRWDAALESLRIEPLAPAQIALGVVRSILPDDNLLVKKLDTGPGNVPRYPVSSIDPTDEAKKSGVDRERLRIMVGEIGLPMSAQQAASGFFRDILTRTDFNAAIAEGDIRPEWADAILEQAAQILSAGQYVEAHLRGWITEKAMYDGTAKHGMSADDTLRLFQISGRPITLKQINTGLARGGKPDSTYEDVPEPYRKALQESNVRPEWASLDYANRYGYPSGFQIRGEAQAHNLTEAQTEQLLLEIGWSPKWAAHFAASWTGTKAATADPWTKRAESQLWSALHRAFLAGDTSETEAVAMLGVLGLDDAAASAVIGLWTNESTLDRSRLSPAQLKKAWAKAVANPLTGQPWTRDEVLAEFHDRGWNSQDANTFLDTPPTK